ncbi:hypothetical protein NW807_05845 [Synechococcus sp. R70.1]|uniref:hypothetical protein n=1 Tax=Synechococcus sp. R70.1 TaxID=2964531 RepID=UPI0039C34E67
MIWESWQERYNFYMVAQVAWDPGRGMGLLKVKPLGRVTIQFYKATDNGVVSAEDMAQIHHQIARVYREADSVGSLAIQPETGRPTEYNRDAETERPFPFPWFPWRLPWFPWWPRR